MNVTFSRLDEFIGLFPDGELPDEVSNPFDVKKGYSYTPKERAAIQKHINSKYTSIVKVDKDFLEMTCE